MFKIYFIIIDTSDSSEDEHTTIEWDSSSSSEDEVQIVEHRIRKVATKTMPTVRTRIVTNGSTKISTGPSYMGYSRFQQTSRRFEAQGN